MTISSRTKLVLLLALFLLPIAASLGAYRFLPEPTANYGELLLPPAAITSHSFGRFDGGGVFRFAEMKDRWVLVASDSGACDGALRREAHRHAPGAPRARAQRLAARPRIRRRRPRAGPDSPRSPASMAW